MSKRARDKDEQSIHDRKVEMVAREYRAKGYSVKADDIEGFTDPDSIHGRVPDVVAKGNGHITVVEVETPSSLGTTRAKEQKRRFKAFASQKTNRHFRLVKV